jgi:hypothetical protein
VIFRDFRRKMKYNAVSEILDNVQLRMIRENKAALRRLKADNAAAKGGQS